MLTFEKQCSNKATISVYIGSTCIRFQDILLELLGKNVDHVTFLRVCLSGVGDVALSFGTLFSYVDFQILGIVFFSRLITIHLTVHFIEQCPPGFHTLLCFRLMPQMLISLSLPRTRLCCQCGFDPFISHLIPMVVGYKEGKKLNFSKNKKI